MVRSISALCRWLYDVDQGPLRTGQPIVASSAGYGALAGLAESQQQARREAERSNRLPLSALSRSHSQRRRGPKHGPVEAIIMPPAPACGSDSRRPCADRVQTRFANGPRRLRKA